MSAAPDEKRRPGGGGVDRKSGDHRQAIDSTGADSTPVQHTIVIRQAGPKFSLRIAPPLIGEDLDRVFDTFPQARGFAGGLRLCRGYRIDAEAQNG